jgi:cell shape-determining protein MreC
MDGNLVAIISALSAAAGVIGTALFQYFSSKRQSAVDAGVGYADAGVGYANAILESHNAVWGEVAELRKELKEERTQNQELSEQLRNALITMEQVLEQKREMVTQMVTLNKKVQGLEGENAILQRKVDHLTRELEWARNQS